MNDDEKRAIYRQRRYLKPSEAALLIRKSKRMVNYWISDGHLTVTVIRGQRYVERMELLRWAADDDRRRR